MTTAVPGRSTSARPLTETTIPTFIPEKGYDEPTIDLLLNRRSVVARNQTEPGPSDEQLEILLRCATRVPDHKKLAPWRIQVLRGDARHRLGRRLAEIFRERHPDATAEQLVTEAARPCRSPLLLVVSTKIESTEVVPRIEQVTSGGALCQNLLVAATALGFASQWLTEWPAYNDQVKQELGIAPSDDILGFFYIGSSDQKPKDRVRPSLDDVVEHL